MMTVQRPRLIKANLIAISGALLAVPVPLLMPMLVDQVLLEKPGALLAWLDTLAPSSWHGAIYYISAVTLLTIALRLGSLALAVVQSQEFAGIAKGVIFRIRSQLLERINRVSMMEYETLGSSTIASHLVTDIDTLDSFLESATSKLLVALLSILGTGLVLLWMHWQLALFFLLTNPLVIFFTVRLGRRVKQLKGAQNKAYQQFQEAFAETLDAIQELRSNNAERHFLDRIIASADRIRLRSEAFSWQSESAARLSMSLFLIGFDLFRAIGMLLVLFSDLSIGEMLAFYAYLWFMMGPVQEVLNTQYAYQSAKAALARINRLQQLQLEPSLPARCDPFCGQKTIGIELRQVCFSYPNGAQVLNNLSLSIAPGEKVALVGASGEGKTTLIQLLLGLYEADSGEIRYGQCTTREIGLEQVRAQVATVLQNPALFNDSLRNNLTLGREHSDADLWRALEIAQLRQTVEQLADGLDSLIGREGVRLSGGQRQRLAVARMVLKDPKVVILDEATSALDATTEAKLHQSVQQFLDGRTVLLVAHRLSAVRQAERILVFKQGQIVEQGRHQELVASQGVYAQLYAEQL
ncbi:MAG: ABC transporter ATP-binding protein [Gammaproteobacteria bacterium]|nr:ABC transporter ATP-binding protein [Gammaproteobacteria bacterium]